jgi:hypothetical protein
MMLATPKENESNRRAAADLSHPIFELTKRLRSAAKTGRRLHLEPEHVELLLAEDIYSIITSIEAKEMRSACRAATANDNATSSATSGCGSGPTVEPGASAGSNVIPMDAASRGASLLLREEAELMRRRKKH